MATEMRRQARANTDAAIETVGPLWIQSAFGPLNIIDGAIHKARTETDDIDTCAIVTEYVWLIQAPFIIIRIDALISFIVYTKAYTIH